MSKNITYQEYNKLLYELKKRIISSRYKAALSIETELILLHHHISIQIFKSQVKHGWGDEVIEQLSKDLRVEFPEMQKFSTRNLISMIELANAIPNKQLLFTKAIEEKNTYLAYVLLINNWAKFQTGREIQDVNGYSILHWAAQDNNLNFICYLYANCRANLLDKTKNGSTILHIAAYEGYSDILSWLLLNSIIDIDVQDEYEQTPLHLAVAGDREKNIKILLNYNADINLADKKGRTPLYGAIIQECSEIKEILLEAGADPSYLLHIAAGHNQVSQVITEKIARNYIDFPKSDYHERTPLHIAALCGHEAAIRALLRFKADINKCDHYGCTALDLVQSEQTLEKDVLKKEKYQKITKILLESGARNGRGLIHAISLYCHTHSEELYQRGHAFALLLTVGISESLFICATEPNYPCNRPVIIAMLMIFLTAMVYLWSYSPVWDRTPNTIMHKSLFKAKVIEDLPEKLTQANPRKSH
jgi:ankyrin repeat protein